MRLIICRHAETEHNAGGVISGYVETNLSPSGIKQAEQLAERLKNEPINRIFSSDLSRAVQTAEQINKFHNLELVKSELIRERYFGSWEGKSKSEMIKEVEAAGVRHELWKSEGGETLIDVEDRLTRFLDTLDFTTDETVLLVTHGSLNRSLLKLIQGLEFKDRPAIQQHNANVNIFEISEVGSATPLTVNCIAHLDESLCRPAPKLKYY